ncbi:MAG: hypothetical protein AB1733_14660 [Thermodesulfobacteriota bacterium]
MSARTTQTVVRISWQGENLEAFFPILREGVLLTAQTGCSIRRLLCDQLGIPGEYVDNRINTIFLDGRAVDDVDRSMVRDGSSLALSAAMPGLVGATMRKGGILASMRDGITHRGDNPCTPGKQGSLRLKLYNMVVSELGPDILKTGVLVEAGRIARLFADQTGDFWKACGACRVDDRQVEPAHLSKTLSQEGSDLVRLVVTP